MFADVLARHERLAAVHQDLHVVFRAGVVFLHDHVGRDVLNAPIQLFELGLVVGVGRLPGSMCLGLAIVLPAVAQDQRELESVDAGVHQPVERRALGHRHSELLAQAVHEVFVGGLVEGFGGRREDADVRLEPISPVNQRLVIALGDRDDRADVEFAGEGFDLVEKLGRRRAVLDRPCPAGILAVGGQSAIAGADAEDRQAVTSQAADDPQADLRVADDGQHAARAVCAIERGWLRFEDCLHRLDCSLRRLPPGRFGTRVPPSPFG